MLRLRFSWKYVLLIPGVLVLYNEALCYWLLPFQWNSQPDCTQPNCYIVLLVADPQILGNSGGIIDKIAAWDCDKYLSYTFKQALSYTLPNIIIFLGDLMDTGHFSSDREFFSDLDRFQDIFNYNKNDITTVILPGDNDIGGEDDIMLPNIVHRFNHIFNQTRIPTVVDNLEIYKVNYLTHSYQEPLLTNKEEVVRIAVSHIPLLPRVSTFVKQVMNKLKPDIIFSGHDHSSIHTNTISNEDLWKRKLDPLLPTIKGIQEYKLNLGVYHEILVPTCSYRMGTSNIGYGVAYIDTSSKMISYQVLWLPRRFTQLFMYVGLLTFSSCLLILFFVFSFFRRIRRVFNLIFSKRILKY